MIFHSLDFVFFFLIVLSLYWFLPRKIQNLFLIVVSCYFYGYIHPWFLIPLVTSAVVDYFAALEMVRRPAYKKRWLQLSLISNLGMLGVFKYYNFFQENVSVILSNLGLPSFSNSLNIILPVGISFYTFQTLSYTVDVYKGTLAPRRNFLDFFLFVIFFPQLVAGPIERASKLLPQIEGSRVLTLEMVRSAVMLIIWGFFKKLVIADNVAVTCNKIFALENPSFPLIWSGVFAFCIQIYADFSAYSDIARGSARLLGFDLMLNFNHPYVSQTPSEFWRRWHISLSEWIRDYIYIPLGGSQRGRRRTFINIFLAFFLSGLWHGASWNFIFWGLYWGGLLVVYQLIESKSVFLESNSFIARAFKIAVMFVFINIGWLMFRETELSHLVRAFTASPLAAARIDWQIAVFLCSVTFIYAIPLVLHAIIDHISARSERKLVLSPVLRVVIAAVLIFGIITMRSMVSSDFIYFQF